MKKAAIWIGAVVGGVLMIGLIAIVLSAVRNTADAESCKTAQILGRAPTGYAYRKPDAATQKKLIRTLKQQDAPHGADIRLLIHQQRSVGYVLVEPQNNPGAWVNGVIKGAKDVGAKSSDTRYGSRDVHLLDYGNAYGVVGEKDCAGVLVGALQAEPATTAAHALFKD
jgi:hypothetical protein